MTCIKGAFFLALAAFTLARGMTMAGLPQPAKASYQKPWRSYQDQVAMLQQRGLVVSDLAAAADFLSHINYYRFSGYCLAFEKARHQFLPNVTFEQVQAAYEFDRVLRDMVTEALEVVEVDLRAIVAYYFGNRYGPFGHTSPANLFRKFDHARWLDKLRDEATRSSEDFVAHFRQTYAEFPDLPIWIVTEVMSFGALSIMFQGMNRNDQRAVASRYGRQPRDMASWMHHLVYIRNLCAHHARLWDRLWSIQPLLPAAKTWSPPLLPGGNRLFATLLILCSLLNKCPTMPTFAAQWCQRVRDLIDRPPSAPDAMNRMGLPPAWKTHPLWV